MYLPVGALYSFAYRLNLHFSGFRQSQWRHRSASSRACSSENAPSSAVGVRRDLSLALFRKIPISPSFSLPMRVLNGFCGPVTGWPLIYWAIEAAASLPSATDRPACGRGRRRLLRIRLLDSFRRFPPLWQFHFCRYRGPLLWLRLRLTSRPLRRRHRNRFGDL